jgi:diadenosine tetraphosphate (Ap4A) HIT family hydrolase
MNELFRLDARLAADCIRVGCLHLSELLLYNDARYPWFVLVPRRVAITEIFELDAPDQQQLCRESARLSQFMKTRFHADKLNIGALGNIVPQLHVHHIARYRGDPAWPGPVWGHSAAESYDQPRITATLSSVADWFGNELEMI